MTIVRSGKQDTGEERAKRHRHAGKLHQRGSPEHDQKGRRRHDLARAGTGEQRQERIEQVAPGDHHGGYTAADAADRDQGLGKIRDSGIGAGCEQRQQGEDRHHRHVLEQQDPKGALAIGLLQLAALLQDFQRDRGGRHGERKAADDGAAPACEPKREGKAPQHRRRQRELRCPEPENGAPQRQQAREFELQPDQKQQQHDAKLGHCDNGVGGSHQRKPEWADDDAGREISHDRGQPQQPCQRHADHGDREQQQGQQQQAVAMRLIHRQFLYRSTDRAPCLAPPGAGTNANCLPYATIYAMSRWRQSANVVSGSRGGGITGKREARQIAAEDLGEAALASMPPIL